MFLKESLTRCSKYIPMETFAKGNPDSWQFSNIHMACTLKTTAFAVIPCH